jgi:hypothetical protein
VNGICETNNVCYTRTSTGSEYEPCGSGCFELLQNCVEECPYGYNDSNEIGICELMKCDELIPNMNVEEFFPCGNECVYDSTEVSKNKCKENCTSHYINVNGNCLSNNCSNRIPKDVEEWKCEIGCYSYVENFIIICSISCPYGYYDGEGKGNCDFVNCDDYELIGNENESCPYNCLFDEFDNSCHSSCSNFNHYEIYNGTCRLKLYNERLFEDNESEFPCGLDCVYDFSKDEGNKCKNKCPSNYVDDKGKCVEIINDDEKEKDKSSSNYFWFIILFIILLVIFVVIKRKRKK